MLPLVTKRRHKTNMQTLRCWDDLTHVGDAQVKQEETHDKKKFAEWN